MAALVPLIGVAYSAGQISTRLTTVEGNQVAKMDKYDQLAGTFRTQDGRLLMLEINLDNLTARVFELEQKAMREGE